MRNHYRSLRVWTLVLLALIALALPSMTVLAQEDSFTYQDPDGRFSVTLPSDWTQDSIEGIARFTSPVGLVSVFVAIEAEDDPAGVKAVLALAAPELTGEPLQTTPVTVASGAWTQRIYLLEGGTKLGALLSQWADGVTYALWFEGDQATFTTAQNQILNVFLSFTIGEAVDLTGTAPQTLTAAMFAELEAYISDARERFHVPGVAIAIVQNGEIVYANGFGRLSANSEQAVTSETLFMIGSITKSMTSLVMATLADEGKIDWDQPVTDILPSFALSDPDATAKIRVRDLLNMSTGVPGQNIRMFLENPSPEEMLAELGKVPMIAKPGQVYNYNNQMVSIGGFAAALASGAKLDNVHEAYARLLQERVLDPIGMNSTTLDFDAAIANPNHALPNSYDPRVEEYMVVPLDWERFAVPVAPAGAVWSNVEDMARYLLMELNHGVAPDGTRLVSQANLDRTQTTEIALAGDAIGYGMGWVIEKYNGLRLIWHNGGTIGFSSDLAFLPEANLGVVVLTNASGAINFNVSVREYVFELAFGLEHKAAERYAQAEEQQRQMVLDMVPLVSDTAVDVEAVKPYVGDYERGVKIELRGDQLWGVGAFAEFQIAPKPGGVEGEYVGVGESVFAGLSVRFSEKDGIVQVEFGSPLTGETMTYQKVG